MALQLFQPDRIVSTFVNMQNQTIPFNFSCCYKATASFYEVSRKGTKKANRGHTNIN